MHACVCVCVCVLCERELKLKMKIKPNNEADIFKFYKNYGEIYKAQLRDSFEEKKLEKLLIER